MPVKVDDCVPTTSVTERVAALAPLGAAGWNRTVMVQVAPGASVVTLVAGWPPVAGPQVDKARVMGKAAAPVPVIAPCPMPVSGTFPVFVSVKN